jgi:hypothetical protein
MWDGYAGLAASSAMVFSLRGKVRKREAVTVVGWNLHHLASTRTFSHRDDSFRSMGSDMLVPGDSRAMS